MDRRSFIKLGVGAAVAAVVPVKAARAKVITCHDATMTLNGKPAALSKLRELGMKAKEAEAGFIKMTAAAKKASDAIGGFIVPEPYASRILADEAVVFKSEPTVIYREPLCGAEVHLGHLYIETLAPGVTAAEYSKTLPAGWEARGETDWFYDLEEIDEPFCWRTETEDRTEELIVAHPLMSPKDCFLLAVLEGMEWDRLLNGEPTQSQEPVGILNCDSDD